MRRPILLALLAAAGLCACQREEPPLGAAPAERMPALSAATAAGPPTFVGRWAVSRAACNRRSWTLTGASLASPSALSCQLLKAERTSAGYTVYSTCAIGKVSQPMRLIFTLTGSGAERSLTLTGGPFTEPVALTRCPVEQQAAENAPPASSFAPA